MHYSFLPLKHSRSDIASLAISLVAAPLIILLAAHHTAFSQFNFGSWKQRPERN
ncbi:MAG: hypothetical protein ACHQT8_07265 [Chlamydiales bacterium]